MNKTQGVGVRINETQMAVLQKLIADGKANNVSTAIQYLINQYAVLSN